MGTLTFSPRYISQVRDLLERERFDVLHFHEPFVPFLSLFLLRESTQRQRRDVPRLRRLLAVVRARQPGHEGATPPGSTAGSRSAPRPATSSTASSRATTRSSPTASTSRASPAPSRSHAGRTARPNVLFVGRHEPRKGLLDLLKAHRILRKTGYEYRLLVVGSGPQEREARRYVATRGLKAVEFLGRVTRRREGAALPDRRRVRLAGDRRRVVRDRAARGDGRRRPDRRLRHPRLQGRRPARSRGPARPAARARRSSPARSPGCSTTRPCAPRWARPAGPGPRTSAGRG